MYSNELTAVFISGMYLIPMIVGILTSLDLYWEAETRRELFTCTSLFCLSFIPFLNFVLLCVILIKLFKK